jgi:hypothetical protein
MSAKLAYAAQLGSALTQKKRIDHLGLVLYDANYQGLAFGQRFDVLDNMALYEAGQATTAGTTWSEYDEPMIEVSGSWNTDARLCLLAQAPNPVRSGRSLSALRPTRNRPGPTSRSCRGSSFAPPSLKICRSSLASRCRAASGKSPRC